MTRHVLKSNIEDRAQFLSQVWQMPEQTTALIKDEPKWWEFWKLSENKERSLEAAVRYMVMSTDDFLEIFKKYIFEIGNISENNVRSIYADAKEYMIESSDYLYTSVIKLPWWMKPFYGTLKKIVVSIVVPAILDYVFEKYLLSIILKA